MLRGQWKPFVAARALGVSDLPAHVFLHHRVCDAFLGSSGAPVPAVRSTSATAPSGENHVGPSGAVAVVDAPDRVGAPPCAVEDPLAGDVGKRVEVEQGCDDGNEADEKVLDDDGQREERSRWRGGLGLESNNGGAKGSITMQETDELSSTFDRDGGRRWEPDAETLREGRRWGLARQRALLVRMAKRRFGTESAEIFEGLLDAVDDPDRLAAFGQWVIEASAPSELAPLDVPESMPSRLEEVLRDQLRETYANAYGLGMAQALLERLAGHRFGPETSRQIKGSIATLEWSSLQLLAEMILEAENEGHLAEDVAYLVDLEGRDRRRRQDGTAARTTVAQLEGTDN